MVKRLAFGCLMVLGAMAAALLLLLVLYVVYSVYANDRAEDAARELCAGIRPGMAIEQARAAARRHPRAPRLMSGQATDIYVFQGAVFHSRDCVVDFSEGRVTRTELRVNDD